MEVEKQKEEDLKRITEANMKDVEYDNEFQGPAFSTTPPYRKPFIPLDINSHCTGVFRKDAYVEVKEGFTPRNNRPSGCGWIVGLRTRNDDAAEQVADVKYTPIHGGGRTHRNIPIGNLTAASVYQDMLIAVPKRRIGVVEEVEIELRRDTTKTELLVELLEDSKRRKKGWHRRDLRFNPKIDDGGKFVWLNAEEKCQLLAEVEMIRVYQRFNGGASHMLEMLHYTNNPQSMS